MESTNNIIVNGDAVVMAASSSSHPAASAVVDPDLVAETAVAAASPSSDPLFTIASDFSSSDSSLTAITAIGDLKSLGLASNYPPGLFQQAIEYIHVYSGMPWWATIFVSTLLLRVILLRLAIPGQRTAARLIPHQAEFKEAQLDIAAAKRRGDMLEVKTLSEKMFARYKELGVNPLAGLLGVLQVPEEKKVIVSFPRLPISSSSFSYPSLFRFISPWVDCPRCLFQVSRRAAQLGLQTCWLLTPTTFSPFSQRYSCMQLSL